jgi:putative membrane protein
LAATAAIVVVFLVGILHVYILVLEMFMWDKLGAGLFWGLYLGQAGLPVKVFFMASVLVAGVYGAATASRKILYI